MKTFQILVLLFAFIPLMAQSNWKGESALANKDHIHIESEFADVKVLAWKGDKVKWSMEGKVNLGIDNDHLKVLVEEVDDGLQIKSTLDWEAITDKVIVSYEDGNKEIFLAKDFDWDKEKSSKKGVKSLNMGMDVDATLTIYVPSDKQIKVECLYGSIQSEGRYASIHMHSTYGDVEVQLAKATSTKALNIESTYGEVDIALSKQAEYKIEVNTSFGEVFTDLNLKPLGKVESSSYHCGGQQGTYTLNDGETLIELTATYDNIFIRELR